MISIFGGLALFLYGMRLMGDGLKSTSAGALKKAMEKVTDDNKMFEANRELYFNRLNSLNTQSNTEMTTQNV